MKMPRILFLLCFLWLVGCGSGSIANPSPEITVFAAASLTDAFTELAEAYEAQNPGVTVRLNFGGSSQLAAQLREGVPADVFASANAAQMTAVVEAGRVEAGNTAVFATNRLTVIVPADNPANITRLEDLAQPGVALILAVEGVPVRQYTDDIVAALPSDFQTNFYANLVSAEDNVRQVAAKIALGEADAGIVYTSDVTPDIVDRVQQIAIPDAQNVIATYPLAPLADAPSPAQARSFIDFVRSAEGQAILARWGFGPGADG
ncbi:MAG: molybdate ABC transporter substrate-binding protein [Anaerolineales bacterium]|nr:molybdate ABC transporter substrate-binding protein [Anaerolineales bacterium]